MIQGVRTITLSGDTDSVPAARRFLADELWGRVEEDVLDTASLLVSEVVTNSVLHARTETSVQLSWNGSGVVVEVSDHSPLRPGRRPHSAESITGRGLDLVEGLADDYGLILRAVGKTVWFTLGDVQPPGPSGWEHPEASKSSGGSPVVLAGLPVTLCEQLADHNEAVLREYALVSLAAGNGREAALVRDAARARELVASAIRAGIAAGRAAEQKPLSIDLRLQVPDQDVPAFQVLAGVFASAERAVADGTLLTAPADPELTRLRDWIVAEVLRQLGGWPPTAWSPQAAPGE